MKRKGYAKSFGGKRYRGLPSYKIRRGSGRLYKRRFRPGFDRTVGVYGRYAGPNAEMKFHDIDIDDAVIAVGGTIQNSGTVNIIPEGVGEEERIGRKITIRKILWRYSLKIAAGTTGAATSDIIRVIMYQDKQCNGLTAVKSGDAGILESDSFLSFNNLSNTGRFRILYDKTHRIQVSAGSGRGSTDTLDYAEALQTGKFFKNCNIPIEYDNSASTGALTSIRSNNLGVLLLSREGSVEFESKMRLRFSDH